MRDSYSKYWIKARDRIYGFMEYDKSLCEYIIEHTLSTTDRLLDAACGTGYPFADYFQKLGYSVYGIDIAPRLIKKCQKFNRCIRSQVGDIENMTYADNYFDCVYCFHSTWYFPNLKSAIDEMIRVAHLGGFVIFDIENRNNKEIDNAFQKRLHQGIASKIIIYIKEMVGLVLLRSGFPHWNNVVVEVPTYPENIYAYLKDNNIHSLKIMAREKNDSIKLKNKHDSFAEYERLIFVITK